MEPTILPGDFVFVNKLLIGPRVYQNLGFLKGEKTPVKRLWGLRAIRRNDVLVFNFPYSDWNTLGFDMNVFYVKRCVAIPGDTFSIENGELKVENYPDSIGCVFRQRELAQMSKDDLSPVIWNCFPYDTAYYQWNIKDFGPLYVPAAGDMIAIDTLNIRLYKKLIEYETDQKLSVRDGHVHLGDDIIKEYTFRLNYYFMAGDYIFDSQDSRYWGLLPEDHIVGKVAFIWKSVDPQNGKFRWERFLKAVK